MQACVQINLLEYDLYIKTTCLYWPHVQHNPLFSGISNHWTNLHNLHSCDHGDTPQDLGTICCGYMLYFHMFQQENVLPSFWSHLIPCWITFPSFTLPCLQVLDYTVQEITINNNRKQSQLAYSMYRSSQAEMPVEIFTNILLDR